MTLTLCLPEQTVHIDITYEQFKRLRDPDISASEIETIAGDAAIDPQFLYNYVEDLKHSVREIIEIDASCDYTDQL
jgi:hypothetical protein